jgi:hypothetical protein
VDPHEGCSTAWLRQSFLDALVKASGCLRKYGLCAREESSPAARHEHLRLQLPSLWQKNEEKVSLL